MAKLTRYLQKIFANNSNQVGVFGTGTDKETSKNVETLQSADYEEGWSSAIITNKNYPIWQEMDGVQYGLSYQIKYLQQSGIPEWLSTETYYTNSYCRVGSTIYYSLQDNNTNHNPALDNGWWTQLLTSNRSIGEIVPSIVPLTDAGLHLLDGSLISGSGIYADFVTYIADLYNSLLPTARTVYNVNIVGSLTNNNGVLSGFSASNYAVISNANIGTASSWEQVWKVTTPNNVSSSHYICSGNNATCYDFGYVDGIWKMFLSSNGTSWDIANGATNNISVSTNTTYLVKLEFTGTAYNMLVSTDDGDTWTTVATHSSSTKVYSVNSFKIGNTYDALWPWNGSIDLNSSYININGQRWWKGTTQIVDCFTDEGSWQASVSQYGSCGKFVYDSENNTVRLPKLGNQIYTTGQNQNSFNVDVYGNGKTLGLINGNGSNYRLVMDKDDNHYLSVSSGSPANVSTSDPGNTYQMPEGYYGVNTNPLTSGIVGNVDLTNLSHSETVYYYIVIATSTKTDIEVDIDEIATDLNGKADVDLTNCTKPHIVETYVNGTSWYRVYSDSWCEQGGTGDTAAQASNSVALLKAYADTNYTLLATNNFQELGNQVNIQAVKTSSSEFNINAKRYGDNSYYVRSYCWYACGYIR